MNQMRRTGRMRRGAQEVALELVRAEDLDRKVTSPGSARRRKRKVRVILKALRRRISDLRALTPRRRRRS